MRTKIHTQVNSFLDRTFFSGVLLGSLRSLYPYPLGSIRFDETEGVTERVKFVPVWCRRLEPGKVYTMFIL